MFIVTSVKSAALLDTKCQSTAFFNVFVLLVTRSKTITILKIAEQFILYR